MSGYVENRTESLKAFEKSVSSRAHFDIIGSAEALPICAWGTFGERERERERERDTERDGSDVTIVALKLATNLHVPFAKNSHNWPWSLHFPLPKSRTFRFSLHGEVITVALKFAMSSHFPLPNNFSPTLFPLFQMARAARRVIENPRQTIKSCPVLLFFPSKKWIKLIPKTIGNRKTDCAWGGSGWETLPEKIYRSQSTNQEGVRALRSVDSLR